MNAYYSVYILTFLLIFSFHCVCASDSIADNTISAFPKVNLPGDMFLLKVKSNKIPSGSFQNRSLNFYYSDNVFKAFDFINIDTKPGRYPIELNINGALSNFNILVNEKYFPVKNITLRSDKVILSPEDERRANEEEKILKSIWNNVTPTTLWEGRFIKPVNSTITSEFGIKRIINKKKESRHRGTDYKGQVGTPINSINNGRVALTANHFFGGNTIVIDHGMGLYSVYLHLSDSYVKNGDLVNKGEIIGLVGNTGRASGPHLHLSVKVQGESINPESLFKLDL